MIRTGLLLAAIFSAQAATAAQKHVGDVSVLPPDPDVGKDMMEIVQTRGYTIEKHLVTTEDGYILGVFRIPCNYACTNRDVAKPVAFLQHGLLDSSYTWVNNFADQSLAYILADAGYDVWMGNNRGNTYSKAHITLSTEQDEFWFFSWDEMAIYDLPAQINYVLGVTNQPKLAYIGHSEGTTQAFAGFSLSRNKAVSQKVALFVALAPVAYVNNQMSKDLQMLAVMNVATKLQEKGMQEFLPADGPVAAIAPETCRAMPNACDAFLATVCGPSEALNSSRIQVYVSGTPAGTSAQNMIHWTQGVLRNAFQMHDFGTFADNKAHYGQSTPPKYDLAAVKVPTALFSGSNDYLADPTDVARIVSEMTPGVIVFQHVEPTYAHLDFTWGYNANEKLYSKVVDLLADYI